MLVYYLLNNKIKMSETTTSDERVKDSILAAHMGDAEYPYKELELHANKLGLECEATEMAGKAEQAAMAAKQAFEASEAYSAEAEDSKQGVEGITAEELRELIKDSRVVGILSLNARSIPDCNRDNSFGITTFGNIQNDTRVFRELSNFQTSEDIKQYFDTQGLTELLTVTTSKRPFSTLSPHSERSDEPVTILTYETITGGYFKHKYTDMYDRIGNFLRFNIILPSSIANELLQYIEAQPDVIRKAVDMLMIEQVGAGEGWIERKPPYERWRAIDGGASHMAIRIGIHQPVEEAKIVNV